MSDARSGARHLSKFWAAAGPIGGDDDLVLGDASASLDRILSGVVGSVCEGC